MAKTSTQKTQTDNGLQPGTKVKLTKPIQATVLVGDSYSLRTTLKNGAIWKERLTRAAKLVVVEHTETLGVVCSRWVASERYSQHFLIAEEYLETID